MLIREILSDSFILSNNFERAPTSYAPRGANIGFNGSALQSVPEGCHSFIIRLHKVSYCVIEESFPGINELYRTCRDGFDGICTFFIF